MAPIRRYLRITKHSVLEVRIYLEKPSDTPWLLSSRDPVLPRIMEEIRPKVLPKLREENENARKKGGKKKRGIRDVAGREDFEVVLFLTDSPSRHALITKQKQFTSKPQITSTSNKLTGWLSNASEDPIRVEDDDGPEVLREEEDNAPSLSEIPEARTAGRSRKVKNAKMANKGESLYVSSSDEEALPAGHTAAAKRRKRLADRRGDVEQQRQEQEQSDDKKKLALNTSYDGFSIYGRILCLIVKRKGVKKTAQSGSSASAALNGGSQMMEQWVSTQANQEAALEDDEEG